MGDAERIYRSIDDLSKSVETESKVIDKMSDSICTSIRESSTHDLTDEEARELRSLVGRKSGVTDFAASRSSSTPELAGMYLELADFGLLVAFEDLSGNVTVVDVTERGRWAIEKHELLKKDALRRDVYNLVVAVASVIIGVILGWILAKL